MYETESPEIATRVEDKRVDLMRLFATLSDDLDRMREQQAGLGEKQSAVSKERERVRRELDTIINPDRAVAAEPMPERWDR